MTNWENLKYIITEHFIQEKAPAFQNLFEYAKRHTDKSNLTKDHPFGPDEENEANLFILSMRIIDKYKLIVYPERPISEVQERIISLVVPEELFMYRGIDVEAELFHHVVEEAGKFFHEGAIIETDKLVRNIRKASDRDRTALFFVHFAQ